MVSSANLDSNWLFDSLKQFPAQSEIKTWWLAYSGGVDSQVLLHLLSQLKKTHRIDLRAVYIDHGLQLDSKLWQQHCAESCELLSIPFQSISVNAEAPRGESPEASARQARYAALAQLIESDHCLLTAQHQDDQAETFLLQLFRSAGAAGLSAMPFHANFSKGWHVRPLLNVNQQQILSYAKKNNLSWVEDPSNQNNKYDRNLIRNTFMPLLKKRWPSIERIISIAAQQQAENKVLIDELASEDLLSINSENNSLHVDDLKVLSEARCRNVLRHWIKQQGFVVAPRKVMQQIIFQVFNAKEDALIDVRWSNAIVHRFRNQLYILPEIDHDESQVFQWHASEPLLIDSLNLKISMQLTSEFGLREDVLDYELQVRFRQSGEKIQPAGRQGNHSLKKLFQEVSVPPWERSRVPLIYLGEELIAVAGYWVDENFKADKNSVAYFPVVSEQ
jgi:tRNA(Ile)-lysidine synthase